jgi:anti-sigma factor RsiW
MNCTNIRKSLVFWAERRLNAGDLEACRAHIQSCPACARLIGQFEAAWTSWGRNEPIEVPANFPAAVMRRVRKQRFANSRWDGLFEGIRWALQPAISTVLLALAIGAGAFLGNSAPSVNQPISASTVEQEYLDVFSDAPDRSAGQFYETIALAYEGGAR